jgi:hypothetical protein
MINKYGFIISAAGGAILTAMLAFLIHSFIVNGINKTHREALAAQETALNARCDADKALTMENARELSKQDAARVAKLKRQLLQRPTGCIPIAPEPAPGNDGAARNSGLSGLHGVTSDALYQYADKAESVGDRLDACQSFVEKTWISRGYRLND